ncbi:hypothetical protein DPMN_118123 [Dreissena polymorpha]|uniref:Uncharacterized protein n=1 Tax=Dreissena polymorpha TaxID=45954 RepID=A0A9D4JLK5_DREPO|nr:hypothetical protein DPMN_118123 [Dreissena polymorpha]
MNVWAPAGNSQTVPESLPDRWGTSKRPTNGARQFPRPSVHLQETPRRCQTVSQTVRAPAEESQAVYDVTMTAWVPAGDSQTVFDV